MSLVKKPQMTEKRLAALEKMREKARGPSTAEGRERIRAAHLKHGFYSKSDEAALRALGEDPKDFRKLRDSLRDKDTLAERLQEELADQVARALWQMQRVDRMADAHALRQAEPADPPETPGAANEEIRG